jgi:ATP synthase protein I
MPEFIKMYNRQRKGLFYLLSIYVLGWGFTHYQTVFLGLILGTVFSFFNLWLMVREMKKFDKTISSGKKVRSLGSLSRMASAAIAVLIALKWPHYFQIISVTLGLMTIYVVIMIDYLVHYSISNK